MKLTIGEAREFVRARLDELAAQPGDMLLGAIDDRNLDNTIDTLLEDAVTFIHLAAPASLMEGPLLTESNFPPGALAVTNRVLDIDTALSDIEDDILRLISFRCGDSDIKLTSAFYEDSPEARMQLNTYIQGQPDSPALVRLDDSPDYKPHYKYYTTDMCLDNLGPALHFVLRYFARPKLKAAPGGTLTVSPASLVFPAGMSTQYISVTSSAPWRIVSNIPDWLFVSERSGVGSSTFGISAQQHRGAERSVSLIFTNETDTAVLEVTQRAHSGSEGNESLRVASTAMSNGVIRLPSTTVEDVTYMSVAASEGLAWTAVLSDTVNFYIAPTSGIGLGIDTYSSVAVRATNANNTGVARTATVTFTAPGVDPVVINLRQPSALTVSPRLTNVPSPAGTYSFYVSTESQWTVSLLDDPDSHPEGFSLSTYSGTGNGTIVCTYPANTGSNTRLLGFKVTGGGSTVQVVISQNAAAQDTISINPASLGPFPASGDVSGVTHTATVTASSEWTIAALEADWLTVRRLTTAQAGSPNLTIAAMSANTTGAPRTATVKVYLNSAPNIFATLSVTQSATDSSLAIRNGSGNSSATVPASGQTMTLNITGTNGAAWTLSHELFATVSPESGTGDASITVVVPANTGNARQCPITVTCGNNSATFYLSQEGGTGGTGGITLLDQYGDSSATIGANVTSVTLQLTAPDGAIWTVVEGETWAGVSPASGTGSRSIAVAVTANTGAERQVAITAQRTGYETPVTFYLRQEGAPQGSITLRDGNNSDRRTVSASATTFQLNITASGPWTLSAGSNFVTLSQNSGDGNATVTATVAANSGSARSCAITASLTGTSKTSVYYLQQESVPATNITAEITRRNNPFYNYDYYDATSLTDAASIYSNGTWRISTPDSWIHPSPYTPWPNPGSGNGEIFFTLDANSGAQRRGTIVCTCVETGVTTEYYVYQEGSSGRYLNASFSPSTVEASSQYVDLIIEASSGLSWTISNVSSALTPMELSGTGSKTVSVYVDSNSGAARTLSLRVRNTTYGLTANVSLAQNAPAVVDNYLRVTPFGTVNVEADTTSVSFTVESDTSWSVASSASGVNFSRSTGSGNGSVTATFGTNTSTSSSRTFPLTFQTTSGTAATVNVTILQAAAEVTSYLRVTPFGTVSIPNDQTSVSFTVESNESWTVRKSNSDTDVTVSPSTGTGNRTVTVSFPANASPSSARTIALQFGTTSGTTLNVSVSIVQQPASPYLRVTPFGNVPAEAGDTSKSFTVESNVSWEASCEDSDVTVSPSSGTGNGTVAVSFPANAGDSDREIEVSFESATLSQDVTIVQAAPAPADISVSPTTANFSGGGGSLAAYVTANRAWTAEKSASWITLSQSSGSEGTAIPITIGAGQNATGEQRTGTVTFRCGNDSVQVAVNQAMLGTISVTPDEVTLGWSAESQAGVSVFASGAWEVDENLSSIPAWLGYNYGTHAGNPGGEILTFVANSANSDATARTATVKIRLTDVYDVNPVTITVSQAGVKVLSISPSSTTESPRNADGTITVTSNTDWRIVQVSEGITIEEDNMSGTGNGSVDWYLSGNPHQTPRTLTITFQTDDGSVVRTFTITQQAGTLTVSPAELVFAAGGEDKSVLLISSASWEVQSQPSWISIIRPSEGLANTPGGVGVTLRAAQNTSTASGRNGTVVFRHKSGYVSQSITVSQGAASQETLVIDPEDVHLDSYAGTTVELDIESSTNWNIILTQTFGITASAVSGSGDATVTLTVPANSGQALRRHVVKVQTGDGGIVRTLYIWQPADTFSIVLDPDIDSMVFGDGDPESAVIMIRSSEAWTAVQSDSWINASTFSGAADTDVYVQFAPVRNLRRVQSGTYTITTTNNHTKEITIETIPPRTEEGDPPR